MTDYMPVINDVVFWLVAIAFLLLLFSNIRIRRSLDNLRDAVTEEQSELIVILDMATSFEAHVWGLTYVLRKNTLISPAGWVIQNPDSASLYVSNGQYLFLTILPDKPEQDYVLCLGQRWQDAFGYFRTYIEQNREELEPPSQEVNGI